MRQSPLLQRIAAIDIGSNSTHLVVADIDKTGHIHIVDTRKEQTRLAAAFDANDRLPPTALKRMTSTLSQMKQLAESYGAEIRAVATHSLRRAKNSAAFCDDLLRASGVPVEVVSGAEEARLIGLGVHLGLTLSESRAAVLDIGGGSTEIVVSDKGKNLYLASTELGCVSLTAEFFPGDGRSVEQTTALEQHINRGISHIANETAKHAPETFVCSSGTVKAVKELAVGLLRKDLPDALHGATLSREEIERAYEALLAAKTAKKRKALPEVDSKRSDILLAGCAILRAFSDKVGVQQWTLSLLALREGLLVDSLDRRTGWLRGEPTDVRWRGVRAIAEKYHVDTVQANRIMNLCGKLFSAMQELHSAPPDWRECLKCAAYLHECGRFVKLAGYHKHSHYIIRNSALQGFTIAEQDRVALLTRFHRKKNPSLDEIRALGFPRKQAQWLAQCAALLRLAVLLESARNGKVKSVEATHQANCCHLRVSLAKGENFTGELQRFATEKERLKEAFETPLELSIAELG